MIEHTRRASPPLRPSLASFVWPISVEQFFADYWEHRPLVCHAGASRVRGVVRDLGALDLERLLGRCAEVLAWRTGSQYQSERVEPTEAWRRYAQGRTLYLLGVPELERWAAGLARGLGAEASGKGNVFASRKGPGVVGHFDQSETFTIQLEGRKRWRVARNTLVTNPETNWVTGNPIPEMARFYWQAQPPSEMPPVEDVIDLEPGSVLYLPRGYWHTTETLEDSVSAELTVPVVSWARLALDGLETLLLRDAAWRARALGAWGSRTQKQIAQLQLAPMLRELAERVASLGPEDLIPVPDDGPHRTRWQTRWFRRNPIATYGVDGRRTKAVTVSLVRREPPDVHATQIELDAKLLPALQWVFASATPFTGAEVAAVVPKVAAGAVGDLIDTLRDTGCIRPTRRSVTVGGPRVP